MVSGHWRGQGQGRGRSQSSIQSFGESVQTCCPWWTEVALPFNCQYQPSTARAAKAGDLVLLLVQLWFLDPPAFGCQQKTLAIWDLDSICCRRGGRLGGTEWELGAVEQVWVCSCWRTQRLAALINSFTASAACKTITVRSPDCFCCQLYHICCLKFYMSVLFSYPSPHHFTIMQQQGPKF